MVSAGADFQFGLIADTIIRVCLVKYSLVDTIRSLRLRIACGRLSSDFGSHPSARGVSITKLRRASRNGRR